MFSKTRFRKSSNTGRRGMSLVELVVVLAIISLLASVIMPLAKVTVKRKREVELRRALRVMREAIDRYKLMADAGEIVVEGGLLSENYPPDLETLVEGADLAGPTDRKVKFLRRIPWDPITKSYDWGLRSYSQDPDDEVWDRDNVWDVFCTSHGTALDGSHYNEW